MKVSEKAMKRLVQFVFKELKATNTIQFKEKEEKVFDRALQLVKADFQREADLDRDVVKMLDDLERQNPEGFERYKMFPMLKKRLAKERGVIL